MKQLLLTLLMLCFVAGYVFAIDIVIDAERDAFYNTLTGPGDGWIYIPYTANNDNNSWAEHDDEYDLSANFWCCWDDSFFYFYEEVWDEWVRGDNTTNWANDCLELKFDPDPWAGLCSGNGTFNVRLTALDSSDFEPDALEGVDNMFPGDGGTVLSWRYVEGQDYARSLTDFGYNVEGRLPWEHIYNSVCDRGPVFAAVGEIFGMAIMNHDNDSGGRDGSIEWASHMSDGVWQYVEQHGTMTFLEGNKLKFSTENTITGIDTNSIDYTPIATAVNKVDLPVPKELALAQNYPNPFNPTTNISFTIPATANTTLKVYNTLGVEVSTLLEGSMQAGSHTIAFDAADLPTGIYYYVLRQNELKAVNKCVVLK